MENQEPIFEGFSRISKSFDDYYNDPTHPYAMVKVFIDGEELKTTFTVEFTQRTNDHDTFKIITPDDSFDSFEGYILEKSRHLFGKNVMIQFARFGKVTQTFEGIITNINNPKHDGGGYGDLHIIGAGTSILLESGKDCRSFENKSLDQIIKEVCENYPREARVEATLNQLNLDNRFTIPYTVQYKESDYEFIKRLAKLHGEFFYYTGDKLIFGNTAQDYIKIQENSDLAEETFYASLLSQDFKYLAYNPETGEVIEQESQKVKTEFKANHFGAMAVIASRKIFPKKPVMQFNNAKNERELEKAVRLEREKRENLFFVKGKSRAPELKIGGRAELSDINGKAMETYRVIEIRHYHDGYDYYNEFIGIPDLFNASPFIDTEAFPLGEIQSARVMDNNDPKGMGRVRVQFPWQMTTNQMTPWIRTTTIYAGAGRGDYKIPEIGDEILVGFESGNAEKPFMLGALYNGAEVSGYATPNNDLKAERTRSGIEGLANDAEGSYKRSTPDGNFLHFDGQGNATLNVPKDLKINVGQNFNINVGQNISFLVGLKAIYNIGIQMMMNTPILKYFVSDNYHLQSPKTLINGDGEIKIEAKETNVAGTQKLLIHSEESAVVNSKGLVEIKGKEGTKNSNDPEDMPREEIILQADALVVFRPHTSWETAYNFAFDWYREGFGEGKELGGTSLKGDEDFKTFAGHYLNNKYTSPFVLDNTIAENLKGEYLKAIACKKDKEYDYYVPKLTIYKHEAETKPAIANISVNFEVYYNEPDEFILEYEEEFFDIKDYAAVNGVILLGKSSTKAKTVKKLDYHSPENFKNFKIKPKKVTTAFETIDISIECKKPFGTLGGKFIKAYTLQEGSDPKNPIKKLAGILQVMPNDSANRKIVNIAMVNVITDINADGNPPEGAQEVGYDTALLEKEKKTIRTFLRQSLIDPVFSIIDLDLSDKGSTTTITRDHFNSTYISGGALVGAYESGSAIPTGWKNLDVYLYEKFNELPDSSNFTNHIRLFYLPQDKLNIIQNNASNPFGGYNSGSNHLNIVLPKQNSNAASSHEIYHSLGLPHTWQNKDKINRTAPFNKTEENGTYSFKYQTTYNIMDYVFPQYYLYHWQSKIANRNATQEPANYTPEEL